MKKFLVAVTATAALVGSSPSVAGPTYDNCILKHAKPNMPQEAVDAMMRICQRRQDNADIKKAARERGASTSCKSQEGLLPAAKSPYCFESGPAESSVKSILCELSPNGLYYTCPFPPDWISE